MSSRHGVVAAGDAQSANAGAELLRAGGNAVDAAVATAFAAFVCELPLCSPLGGGVMLVELANGDAHALDMFARTPGLGGSPPAKLDFGGMEVSFGAATQLFHVGRASVAVPLTLPGLVEAHRRWGVRPLAEVVAPAVALARGGFTLGHGVAIAFDVVKPIVETTAACRALYVDREGVLAKRGSLLVNPELGTSLEDLARKPDFLRDLFAAFAREFGPANGGLVTARDVEEARIAELPPIRMKHGAWDVATMPAPSTGGMLVALGLRLHEGDSALAWGSPEYALAVARVQEVLLEERCRASIDPAFVAALRARLASKRSSAIGPPDNPLGSTTHLSAIDDDGIAVAMTLTNGESCGHVLPGTGMIANNLLGEEDLHPNGFHVDPPGKPLRTMMAPTILRCGDRRIALGSGGSNRLRNAILQVILGHVEHGVDVESAVGASRIHLEPSPDGGFRVAFEDVALQAGVAAALTTEYPRDPAIFAALHMYFGGVHAAVAKGDGSFEGAGDPRRGGAVAIV